MYAASPPPARLCTRVMRWVHTQINKNGQSTGQAELAIGAEVRLTRLLLQPELNGTVYINMYLHTRDD